MPGSGDFPPNYGLAVGLGASLSQSFRLGREAIRRDIFGL